MDKKSNQVDPLEMETKPDIASVELDHNTDCIEKPIAKEIYNALNEFNHIFEIKEENDFEIKIYNEENSVTEEIELKSPVKEKPKRKFTRRKTLMQIQRKRDFGKYKWMTPYERSLVQLMTKAEKHRARRANSTILDKETVRERARMRAASRRASMSESEKQAYREKDRIKKMQMRAALKKKTQHHNHELGNSMTPAEKQRAYRANYTALDLERAREKSRIQTAARRASMSETEKQEYREKERIKQRLKRAALTEEQRQHHRERDRIKRAAVRAAAQAINCAFCDISFPCKQKLAQHLKVHKCDEPYICSVCDKRFLMEIFLIDHMKRHLAKKQEKTFICSYCGKGSSSKNYLVKHERSHGNENPSFC